tara:strand:+ start:1731 stop:2117 length:387 start_codon:yes stop_codon:yes gene_type:complete
VLKEWKIANIVVQRIIMANLANKPPLGLKKPKAKKNRKSLAHIGKQNCIICETYDMQQTSPTQVHHVINDRYSTRKTPDECAIPLCEGHHQGMFDTSKIAIHREPLVWRKKYGADYNYSEKGLNDDKD